jgi:glutamate synthase domain-containing protein 2/glutamate synthase domain-containing protein 1/glutamate synthase domain-containing protein 3
MNRYPLYDPLQHHDACGVGFIADRTSTRSHRIVRLGVQCLHNLDHRGARSADGTGDGAGIMTRIPFRIIERDLAASGVIVPPRDRLGVVVAFLPRTGPDEAKDVVEAAVRDFGMSVLMWRRVPVDRYVLSPTASQSLPVIQQAIVRHDEATGDVEDFEKALFLARKQIERLVHIEGFDIVSASARTVVYKGLFTADMIEQFYWDLRDPAYESDFVIFHQRYSTNTKPAWALAQPFRMLAHNGEINTVQGNRAWMAARSNDLGDSVWGVQTELLAPLVRPGLGSDSASLDEAFEVLIRSGRGLAHVKEMLIPEAWENVRDLDPERKAFHEYHAFLTEPWDGPAAIAASDGRTLIAGLDRNGLRPARWAVSPDTIVVASEAGIAPEVEVLAEATGQLGPGEILEVDLESGLYALSETVKHRLAQQAPYGDWITTQTNYVSDPFDDLQDDRFDAAALARVFGYTAEERLLLLEQMSEGVEPILSMGHDTGLAALSALPQRVPRYFHQAFAQVTNPPMDPIREKLVMSLRTYVGTHGSLLEETEQQAHMVELDSPVLSDAEVEQLRLSPDPAFRSEWIDVLFDPSGGADAMVGAIHDACAAAEDAVRSGASIVILSDRALDGRRAPVPIVMAVGAVHHHLIDTGLRLKVSIIAVSGEPRDAHDLACLIGFGAAAVNPYLAIEQVRAMAAAGKVPFGVVEAQENYRTSLEKGLLKIMSKMGICTVKSYRSSELFEAIGLDQEVCDLSFRYVQRRIGGVGFDKIAADVATRHARYIDGGAEIEGYYKHRGGGVAHAAAPLSVLALQRAVRSGEWEAYEKYVDLVTNKTPSMELRDHLRIDPLGEPISIDKVVPAEDIMRRFVTAAMSLGALSQEAHETLAEAMHRISARSNSGEGGEDPARFGTERNSAIKQVASGRFGVTPAYLASADEYQIKMAQGSKPGEGGQLPGHKVTPEIAALRHTEPGVTLISPPPHHDIYSIEDLAQLIYDLKTFKPTAQVSVKLVSGPGVGTIAVGVAKAHADGITVSGNGGGTGASPLVSIKHAGSPWEIGLAEAHQALVANGLRSSIFLETDGGLRTGRDIVIASLLGADRFGFGTLPLLALGCKMVRQCHLNTCPVGIATQREDLRAKFTGSVDQVVALFSLIAEDVRRILAGMGATSLESIIGRADLLTATTEGPASDFETMLVRADLGEGRPFRRIARSPLGEILTGIGRSVLETGQPTTVSFPIQNTERSVGARLSGEVAAELGDTGLPPGSFTVRLSGTAGQSFGAFLAEGIDLDLDGVANDYVGKGMGGGSIAIHPHVGTHSVPHVAGNACLYGATSGSLFAAGTAGQRFAVRNSGARAVIEGASDHIAEYMTGGTVVVLGDVGRNIAAGMTGGTLYLYDPDHVVKGRVSESAPPLARLTSGDADQLLALVTEHRDRTGSKVAESLLGAWESVVPQFWILRPEPPEPSGNEKEIEVIEAAPSTVEVTLTSRGTIRSANSL